MVKPQPFPKGRKWVAEEKSLITGVIMTTKGISRVVRPVLERKISAKRISRALRSATGNATKLEKAEKNLAAVDAKLTGFGDAGFSAAKARLEMDKRAFETEISSLHFEFDQHQSLYFQYLEKNAKLSSK